ncbi:LysR family transcriptional regulator [Salinisphaera sp. G21_0]|uniref:LysR family transcriptional regulator n=1 Tax=Salinisphaera sp. G21_0 TaxID=2821094 RepID=UPI001AD9A3E3|nr:LysR family transcriptional regulator [Salinisphaera sp. G21_0]MBO9482901.1 LysR family transcriptional regulator [Salinisphaera sp. G21_0]
MSKDLRNFDLNLLVVFHALSEEAHLTRTAERLHLSQPAVSNALSRLRDLFEDELFVRAPKGMRPTPKAKSLTQPIQEALNLIQSQLTPVDTFCSETAKNCFTISVNEYAELIDLPDFIRMLRASAPNVSLDIYPESNSTNIELIRSGEIDIAIDYLPITGKELVKELFYEERLVVIASNVHPILRDKLSTGLYTSLPYVAVRPRDHRGSHTQIILGKKSLKRNITMTVTNMLAIPQIVSKTDMLSIVPKRLAEYFQSFLPIAIHALPFDLDRVPIYMYYHQDKVNNQAHKWFRQQLLTISNL